MALRSIPLLFPNLRGVWLMNQWATGFIYDLTGQARHMSTNGTIAFQQHTNNLLRYLTLDGSSTYLSRASEAALEITGTLSVMGWFYKTTAGTTLPLISKTSTLSASTNLAWFLANGSGWQSKHVDLQRDHYNKRNDPQLQSESGFLARAPTPPAVMFAYTWARAMGGALARIRQAFRHRSIILRAVGLTIGALHGGSSFASGNCAMAAIMNSTSNETLFRTLFEHTKGAFF
jgi:hypothetical protein